ncbi:hypothetical protein ACJIZ3_014629 [Penstemon smallii]|uniref:DUF4005 domain-containing protein n=1 Tax=Penstemon smallii TaxID=265156 RepID=A0ABD3RNK2_9LAMI
MGKSPGKWIKTVLFGKKYSKSNFSKNVVPDKKSAVTKTLEDPAGISPVISDPSQFAENIVIEKGTSDLPCANNDSQSNTVSVPLSDVEIQRQEQAATKAQASFRGYLARRAFRALKGIIRLQALIRGHLVRRQAVATLCCMQAIVKFQAHIRGKKDAKLVGTEANLFFGSAKYTFVHKLLVSLPTTTPLSLQYDPDEPNSAWNWVERWSLSRFWEPPTLTKKISNTKPQRKQGGAQNVELESGKSKRTIRKNGDNGTLASYDADKPKRNPRKITTHQTELVQEQHPQNELERVKRNLRKVTSATEKTESETEKPQPQPQPQPHQNAKTAPIPADPDTPEQGDIVISSENQPDSDAVVDKLALLEAPSRPTETDEPVDVSLGDHPVVETHCSENGEKTESTITLQDELSSKENQKMKKRRSLPAKQEYTDNISHNTSRLPSYMAATKSAKAKLRAQGSSIFVEDGDDSGYVRRHSLPAVPINGKVSSSSPRVHKPMQANGKGSNKTNRLLMTSGDDKMLQPGWRR